MKTNRRIPSWLRWIGISLLGTLILILVASLIWSFLVNRQIESFEIYTIRDGAPGVYTMIQGYEIHYQLVGDPRNAPGDVPLMLIHGFTSSGREFERIIPGLAGEHKLIIPDLLGYGHSQRVTERVNAYTHRGQAEILNELLDQLGVAQVDLVGASYGGGIAAQFALDYPERVRRLVFLDAEVYGEGRSQAFIAYLPFGLNRALTWYALGGGPIAKQLTELACYDVTACEGDGELSEAREALARIKGTTDALIAFSKTAPDQRIPAELEYINSPALVIWGAEDRIITPENGQRLADALNSRLVWIERAGHTPHIERPEQVAPLILEFLNTE